MSVSGAERARLLALIQSSAEQTIAKAKADGTPIIPYGSDVVLESEAINDTQKVENDVMGKRGTKAMEEDSIQKAENGYGNDEIEPESKERRPKSSLGRNLHLQSREWPMLFIAARKSRNWKARRK